MDIKRKHRSANFATENKSKDTISNNEKATRGIAATVLLIAATTAQAQSIVGRVVDAKTKEPLIGAVVSLQGTRRQADHQERHLPAQKMGVYRRWYGLDYRMGQLGS